MSACELRLKPSRGVYVKYFAVSDFDVHMEKGKGSFAFYPVPVEFARITNGRVDYGGRKYLLREMTVSNFNTGRPLEFTIDGGVEGLGNLKTKGGGLLFPDLRSDIKGEYRLSAVHIDKVLKDYEGLADSWGSYTVQGRAARHGRRGDGALFLHDGGLPQKEARLARQRLSHPPGESRRHLGCQPDRPCLQRDADFPPLYRRRRRSS